MARRFPLLAVLAAALLATGCGTKEPVTDRGDTEGIWVDAGTLDYHVNGSRILNPSQVPDDRYLAGVPPGEQPTKDETWFAVFLRIENKTDATAPTAEEFEIEDTEGNVYRPVELDSKVNAFVYTPTMLRPAEVVPHFDSSQELSSTAGAMVLFKIPLTDYQNRPLEFSVHSADGEEPKVATLDLDV